MKKTILIIILCIASVSTSTGQKNEGAECQVSDIDQYLENFRTAIEYFLQGRFKDAIAIYDQILKAEPLYCAAMYNRGLAHFYDGNATDAKKDFEKASSLGSADAGRTLKRINQNELIATSWKQTTEAPYLL
jgi:tetratricopeptide (TPR) repeat protein